jgi:hypothetical protein
MSRSVSVPDPERKRIRRERKDKSEVSREQEERLCGNALSSCGSKEEEEATPRQSPQGCHARD